jgi:hypothetical protein
MIRLNINNSRCNAGGVDTLNKVYYSLTEEELKDVVVAEMS